MTAGIEEAAVVSAGVVATAYLAKRFVETIRAFRRASRGQPSGAGTMRCNRCDSGARERDGSVL